jgi:hypothetical protein
MWRTIQIISVPLAVETYLNVDWGSPCSTLLVTKHKNLLCAEVGDRKIHNGTWDKGRQVPFSIPLKSGRNQRKRELQSMLRERYCVLRKWNCDYWVDLGNRVTFARWDWTSGWWDPCFLCIDVGMFLDLEFKIFFLMPIFHLLLSYRIMQSCCMNFNFLSFKKNDGKYY